MLFLILIFILWQGWHSKKDKYIETKFTIFMPKFYELYCNKYTNSDFIRNRSTKIAISFRDRSTKCAILFRDRPKKYAILSRNNIFLLTKSARFFFFRLFYEICRLSRSFYEVCRRVCDLLAKSAIFSQFVLTKSAVFSQFLDEILWKSHVIYQLSTMFGRWNSIHFWAQTAA